MFITFSDDTPTYLVSSKTIKAFCKILGLALLIYVTPLFANEDIPSPPLLTSDLVPPQYHYRIPTDLSDGWKVGNLQKEKIDLNRISRGIDKVLTGNIPEVRSLLVIRHGKIMLDEYFNGGTAKDAHALYSCTKSVFSTVYGIAQDQGLLKLNEKVYDFYPGERSKAGWDSRKDSITIGMLLAMTSGLNCDDAPVTGSPCWQDIDQSTDWLSFCLELPLNHPPGTTWSYNGSCLVLLSNLIIQKTGMTMTQYADKYLLQPLGIQGDSWTVGPAGVTRVDSGLVWKPRDMAKLGQLYLNRGLWDGNRIVSEAWVKDATEVHAPPGQAFGHDYGYLWHIQNMTFHGRTVKVFYANGYMGQDIFVSPDADLVCVMTADSQKTQIYTMEEHLFEDYILGSFN